MKVGINMTALGTGHEDRAFKLREAADPRVHFARPTMRFDSIFVSNGRNAPCELASFLLQQA